MLLTASNLHFLSDNFVYVTTEIATKLVDWVRSYNQLGAIEFEQGHFSNARCVDRRSAGLYFIHPTNVIFILLQDPVR
jgi:hypothetical protein